MKYTPNLLHADSTARGHSARHRRSRIDVQRKARRFTADRTRLSLRNLDEPFEVLVGEGRIASLTLVGAGSCHAATLRGADLRHSLFASRQPQYARHMHTPVWTSWHIGQTAVSTAAALRARLPAPRRLPR